MSDVRPDPFTPADCNLRGFQWMPIDVVRLLDSDLFLLASGDEFKAALALWCKSWSQVPAASLPADERLLAGLSGAKNWKKVRDVAMRGWVMCSDGRYYHAVVAEKAREAMVMAKAHADQKAAAAERKAQEREDRSRMFALLRERGIVADFHTNTSKLREMVAALPPPTEPGGSKPDVTRDKSQHVTAKTRPDTTGHEQTVLNSAPNGAGGAAAVIAFGAGLNANGRDLSDEEEKVLWNAALALLIPSYSTGTDKAKDAKARSFVGGLGKKLKDAGVERRALFDVIQAACVERPVNPESWLAAAVATRVGNRQVPNKQQAIEQRNRAVGDEWLRQQGIEPGADPTEGGEA